MDISSKISTRLENTNSDAYHDLDDFGVDLRVALSTVLDAFPSVSENLENVLVRFWARQEPAGAKQQNFIVALWLGLLTHAAFFPFAAIYREFYLFIPPSADTAM